MGSQTQNGAVVLVGCGRLGSSILEGWLGGDAVAPAELIILTPSDKPAAEAARARGARINPPLSDLGSARAVLLAVKPAVWRGAVAPLIDDLAPDAVVVSVMAGVGAGDIAGVMHRPVARVMPTTAVAQGAGVAALWSADERARRIGRDLFAGMADVVDLTDEALMDASTAVAGSAPAFVLSFVAALARAGEAEGLPPEAAARLARGALRSAASGVATGQSLDDLIARIASPGGTTRAGLDAMAAEGRGDRVATAAVEAAIARAKTF